MVDEIVECLTFFSMVVVRGMQLERSLFVSICYEVADAERGSEQERERGRE